MSHPYLAFRAPPSIQAGVALKDVLGPQAVTLIGRSFADVLPRFPLSRFERQALVGLDDLELMQRADHIAAALQTHLPADIAQAVDHLIAALGPPLAATEGNGLAPFFYLPHSAWIARHALADRGAGLRAIRALTCRFTGEYAIRPFLHAEPTAVLAELAGWTADPDPHVRRLVSEGTRPRLPWGMRLQAFQRDPLPVLPLLEALKDDPSLYVRRSVANHLGDIAKDHPHIAYGVCRRWLDETTSATRRWMVRHAVRLPAKRGEPQAMALRSRAGGR